MILTILCQLSWFCWLLSVEPKQHEWSLEEVQTKLIASLKATNSAAKRLTKAYKDLLETEDKIYDVLSGKYCRIIHDSTTNTTLFDTATFMVPNDDFRVKNYMVRPKSFNIVDQDGKILVEISLKDGKAKLHGSPNKAAKIFWKAIGRPENMR
jgi:uncharacterized protein